MTTRKSKQHDDQKTADSQEIIHPEDIEPALPEEEELPPQEPMPVVEEAVEDTATLQKERDEARAIATEYLDGWQRAIADFANYKKRAERDREQVQLALIGTIVKRYLEVIDDLERALKTRPKDNEGAAWADGIELIYRKLLIILDSQDVKPMDVLGQPFDPNKHEAIGQMESEVYPSGHVAEVIHNGYLIGDRVLRPALVRIAG
jgi:molecular chaperone GrpE